MESQKKSAVTFPQNESSSDENVILEDDTRVEVADETSFDFDLKLSKASTKSFQIPTKEEIILSERHRYQLIKDAEKMIEEYQAECVTSIEMNNLLHDYLKTTNISHHVESYEEKQHSMVRYEQVLEQFYKVNKQKEALDLEILEKSNQASERKMQIEDQLHLLKNELNERMLEYGAKTVNPASGQPLPDQFWSKLIDRFMKKHEELSAERLDFISIQNILMELKEKNKQLDDLGGGFKVIDYENIKAQVQTLSSNIDLKQEQLDKLRERFKSENRKVASTKQKHIHIAEMIKNQVERHDKLRDQETEMRGKLNDLKIQKNSLRDENNRLSQKAGILKKAPLMRDYDRVSKEIQKLSSKTEKVEALNENLTWKVDELQKKIDLQNPRKSRFTLNQPKVK